MIRFFRAVLAGVAVVMPSIAWALSASPLHETFTTPVYLTAPAGDTRLFIVEKAGRIQLFDGTSQHTYLDIRALVDDSSDEGGLLGLAFDPGFASNGRLYINYIDNNQQTVVSMFTASSAGAMNVDPVTEKTILTVAQPAGRDNHKAGWIGFRNTDHGQLYIATGDGGGGNDPDNLAQNLNSNLGKILRVTPLADGGYTVPADNPYVGIDGNDEIWAAGLRNPYRNSFDRQSGDFWIADVGQDRREELNLELHDAPGGANYGWRAREGDIDNPSVPDDEPPGAIDPFFAYAHGSFGETVIGGYVYRGHAEPGLDGSYFFGDFVSGRIFTLRNQAGSVAELTERTAELGTPFPGFQLSSFGEDGLGNLYAMGVGGQVFLIAAAVPEPASWAMWMAGVAGLLGWARRQRDPRRMARQTRSSTRAIP